MPPRLAPVVDRDDRTVRLEQDHDFQCGFEHGSELRLRRSELRRLLFDLAPQFELGFLGDRDVAPDTDEAHELAIGAEARLRDRPQPAMFAVPTPVSALERKGLERSFAGDALGNDPLDVVGMDARTPVERACRFEVAIGSACEFGIGFVDEIAGAIEPRHPH